MTGCVAYHVPVEGIPIQPLYGPKNNTEEGILAHREYVIRLNADAGNEGPAILRAESERTQRLTSLIQDRFETDYMRAYGGNSHSPSRVYLIFGDLGRNRTIVYATAIGIVTESGTYQNLPGLDYVFENQDELTSITRTDF